MNDIGAGSLRDQAHFPALQPCLPVSAGKRMLSQQLMLDLMDAGKDITVTTYREDVLEGTL